MDAFRLECERTVADLAQVLRGIDAREVVALESVLLEAPAIHVVGSGRSSLVARAFAMRLAHLGRPVHVLGDATAPALGRGEVLLVCSASGDAAMLKIAAERALRAGGRVAVITAGVISPLARIADVRVNVPPLLPPEDPETQASDGPPEGARVLLPVRVLFEQSALLLFDVLAIRLARALGQSPGEVESRLPNLE